MMLTVNVTVHSFVRSFIQQRFTESPLNQSPGKPGSIKQPSWSPPNSLGSGDWTLDGGDSDLRKTINKAES